MARMEMDSQRLEGEAAEKLIEKAGEVTSRAGRDERPEGVGRRVDTEG